MADTIRPDNDVEGDNFMGLGLYFWPCDDEVCTCDNESHCERLKAANICEPGEDPVKNGWCKRKHQL